jgi:predicted DNA-binding protein (MmcQ/YjbR family)
MTADELRKLCLSLSGATETIQWGDDRVFKIAGKMFACSGLEDDSNFSFKVDEHRFLELTDVPGVRPAPYLARAKWIQIEPARCELANKDLANLVRNSYELVFGRLPKKTQKLLNES